MACRDTVRAIVVLCRRMDLTGDFSSLQSLQSDCFSWPRAKQNAEQRVGCIKVPSVCLDESSSPPSVCVDITPSCVLYCKWLLFEPGWAEGRARQAGAVKLNSASSALKVKAFFLYESLFSLFL